MPASDRGPLLVGAGMAIRRLREAAGYSQENFAKHIGVHRTFMGTLERGQTNPSLATLALVADGLGLTLAALVAEIERAAGTAARQRKRRSVAPKPATDAGTVAPV